MIDIKKIESFHFYERYGIADLIFMYSKNYDLSVSDVIDNKTEDDIVDFYNEIYRKEFAHKFRLYPTLDIINNRIIYEYIDSRIYNTSTVGGKLKYYNVSSNGLASKSIYLSPNIISKSGSNCITLFDAIQQPILKDDTNTGSISPFVTKVCNKYKSEYNKYTKLELIGQIVANLTRNKFHYRNIEYNNTGIFVDFENLYDYFPLIEYIYNKNLNTLLITEIKDMKDSKTLMDLNKNEVNTKPPLILDGNIDRKMTFPFNHDDYVFIDIFIEYCNKVHMNSNRLPNGNWYSVSVDGVSMLNFNREILDISIKYDYTFRELSMNLLSDYSVDSKNSERSKYFRYLTNFYKSFSYIDFNKLLNNTKNFLLINYNNPILIKFINTMNKNKNVEIQDMIRDINSMIYLISKEKCDKLGYIENTPKYKEGIDFYMDKLRSTVFNYINASNSPTELLHKMSKMASKYNHSYFIKSDTVNYILNDLVDFAEFKKVSSIYLHTRFPSRKSDTNTLDVNVTLSDTSDSDEGLC